MGQFWNEIYWGVGSTIRSGCHVTAAVDKRRGRFLISLPLGTHSLSYNLGTGLWTCHVSCLESHVTLNPWQLRLRHSRGYVPNKVGDSIIIGSTVKFGDQVLLGLQLFLFVFLYMTYAANLGLFLFAFLYDLRRESRPISGIDSTAYRRWVLRYLIHNTAIFNILDF